MKSLSLSKSSPAEINAAVGEHVAHVTPRKQMVAMNIEGTGMALWENEITSRNDVIAFCQRHPEYKAIERDQYPDYLHDANAVLPLLEKYEWSAEDRGPNVRTSWRYSVMIHPNLKEFKGEGRTFCLAAIAALLRAAGVKVEE